MSKSMTPDIHPLIKLLCEDRRYKLEAYQFVRSGLEFAQDVLELGRPEEAPTPEGEVRQVRHVTGQDLSHALKQYAHDQYGYMAKLVLAGWGITCTSDFGEIVYNLIKIGEMTKSPEDRREDFDQVFDFDQALVSEFIITAAEDAA
ncbi:Minf_1886 family protein [Anatilimnocola sp. NA78]|uniref:Minf_1886 family protein n=1 Tax=Anatilimnocola sp. NA78 TaxID=3415683 RepID=UPI003CE59A33